jgi:adenylate kinase family enzyme
MSTSELTKRIVIIAGPNGAGKTTFAREFLPTDVPPPFCAWHRQFRALQTAGE